MNSTQPNDPAPGRETAAEQGDRLEEVFQAVEGELLGTLYYLLGNLEEARDALQETFVKCWRKREACADVVNLKSWVFRVALNTGRDMRRAAWVRRRQPMEIEDTAMQSAEIDPAAKLRQSEELEQVRLAILDLRPEEQEVFLLRQNGDMTYEEIAQAISVPIGTVKTRMRSAITKLRSAVAH